MAIKSPTAGSGGAAADQIPFVSDTFDAKRWRPAPLPGPALQDITYHRGADPQSGRLAPVARIAFNRPEVRNAFRPQTVDELYRALDHARCSADVAAIILTGNGPAPDGGYAFCSGGDQRVRGRDGYCYTPPAGNPYVERHFAAQESDPQHVAVADTAEGPSGPVAQAAGTSLAQILGQRASAKGSTVKESTAKENSENGGAGANKDNTESDQTDARVTLGNHGRLHILEVQRLMRATPKPIIAAIPGWAAGGGHSLIMCCDLAVASAEHARFKQTDANVGSFDAGYGSALLARQVGDKRARQIFFLAQTYDATQAEQWGVINQAVPHADLETTAWDWALTIATKSPQAIRMLKYAFNLVDDGLAGQQMFAGEATRMAYMSVEAQEGRDAFLEKRDPDWSPYPYYF